jgi:DNA-binding NarL/FixJ family response regulator
MKRTGFIIAVESYLLRKGLASVLNRIPGAYVACEFAEAGPLLECLKTCSDEYILISQSLFQLASSAFLNQVKLLDRTLLVGDHPPEKDSTDAHAFIRTTDSKDVILQKLTPLLVPSGDRGREAGEPELSQRERTIVRLASMGYTNREIAEKLFLSSHTVTTHRRNISSKLGIKSLSALTVYAIVNNIISIEELSSLPDQ